MGAYKLIFNPFTARFDYVNKGGATPTFADNETPTGDVNGINDTFTLAHAPSPAASLLLELNGQVQTQGVEYTLSGLTITFASPPAADLAGLPFKAFYRY